ncbi:hypothetical protein Tco_0775106 [Tanacetum coccineum]
MLATMNQIVNLLSGFQKQFPSTNNQLRTFTNPMDQANIHSRSDYNRGVFNDVLQEQRECKMKKRKKTPVVKARHWLMERIKEMRIPGCRG